MQQSLHLHVDREAPCTGNHGLMHDACTLRASLEHYLQQEIITHLNVHLHNVITNNMHSLCSQTSRKSVAVTVLRFVLQLHVEMQQSMQQLSAIQSELRGNINFMNPG